MLLNFMGYKLLAKAPHLVQQDLPLPRRQSKGPHKLTHSQQELKTSMFKLRLCKVVRTKTLQKSVSQVLRNRYTELREELKSQ